MSATEGYMMECYGLVRASGEAYRWLGRREAVVFERSHLRHLSRGVEFVRDDVARPEVQLQEVRSVMIRCDPSNEWKYYTHFQSLRTTH
jgi:hypothetical protein